MNYTEVTFDKILQDAAAAAKRPWWHLVRRAAASGLSVALDVAELGASLFERREAPAEAPAPSKRGALWAEPESYSAVEYLTWPPVWARVNGVWHLTSETTPAVARRVCDGKVQRTEAYQAPLHFVPVSDVICTICLKKNPKGHPTPRWGRTGKNVEVR